MDLELFSQSTLCTNRGPGHVCVSVCVCLCESSMACHLPPESDTSENVQLLGQLDGLCSLCRPSQSLGIHLHRNCVTRNFNFSRVRSLSLSLQGSPLLVDNVLITTCMWVTTKHCTLAGGEFGV